MGGGKCAGKFAGRVHGGKVGYQYTRIFSSQDIDISTNCKIFDTESLKLP